jgi:hypothetical protein
VVQERVQYGRGVQWVKRKCEKGEVEHETGSVAYLQVQTQLFVVDLLGREEGGALDRHCR